MIGGLVAYTYLSIGLPGSSLLLDNLNSWGILLVTLVGSGGGMGSRTRWKRLN